MIEDLAIRRTKLACVESDAFANSATDRAHMDNTESLWIVLFWITGGTIIFWFSVPRLTSKFYAKEAIENDLKIKQDEINSIKHGIDNLFNQGPRQKLSLPKLESQK